MSAPFEPRRLPDGRIEAPMRAEDPESGMIGDGVAILVPGDERFEEWDAYLRHESDARSSA
jgi:hypothetical protein